MIERDDNIPPLAELLAEVETARNIAYDTLGQLERVKQREVVT
jgi:uncharacterized protein (UPF0276 family)